MLAHALRYIMAGWRVFPLVPGGKLPVIPSAHPEGDPLRGKCKGECGREGHGVYDASDDPETVAAWFHRWPTANIGLAIPDDLVVLDVDPRHGGRLDYLRRLGLDETTTATQRTAGGGWHVLYEKPRTMAFVSRLAGFEGLDILTAGRYIVAAPSRVAGNTYRWERDLLDVEPARLPLKVAERLQKRAAVAITTHTTSASTPAGDAPPFYVIEHALAHLDPWGMSYDEWVRSLMAIHNAYPDAQGLDLAERWGDGKPGEIAGKWAGFEQTGGVTWRLIIAKAKAIGWRPELAGDAAPTMDTAHDILHAQLEKHGGDCEICGRSFFEKAVDGDTVRGRRRVMMCHRRDCATWQSVKIERQIMEGEPWAWPGWFVSEHNAEDWRRLVNGPLASRPDWLGAPTVHDTICLFTAWQMPGSVSVSLQTMLEMATERLLAIPEGKRLRRSHAAARSKKAETIETVAEAVATVEAAPASRLRWTRWAFGLDLLHDRDAWTVLAIIEKNGGTVTPKGSFSYPLRLDGQIIAAVAAWQEPSRREIDAYTPPAPCNASISPVPSLPEQEGYRRMSAEQRRYARLIHLADVEKEFLPRQLARTG